MKEILSQREIDLLLEEINTMPLKPNITLIRPSEIESITDQEERRKYQENFDLVHFLYVYPLEKLLKYVSTKKGNTYYKVDYGDEPIIKRMKMLQITLMRMGYNVNQILSMVPKTQKEIDVILEAKRLGYDDPYAVANENRVALSQNYLTNYTNQNEEETHTGRSA